jgi:hypothetical protein
LGSSYGSHIGVHSLVNIFGVDGHEDLACADIVAQIYVSADNLAGNLEGQIAFVMTSDFAGISVSIIGRGNTCGNRAHQGNLRTSTGLGMRTVTSTPE